MRQRVASSKDLPEGSLLRVEAGGTAICLVHAEDGKFYAMGDTCTHEEYSLCEGELWEMSVECPRHGSLFDLSTGRPKTLPAFAPVQTFPIAIEDDTITLEVE